MMFRINFVMTDKSDCTRIPTAMTTTINHNDNKRIVIKVLAIKSHQISNNTLIPYNITINTKKII